jgi:hypothetical protein
LQNAPLTEQQNAAITALSHAVAERPFPANLVRRRISQSQLLFMLYASLVEISSATVIRFLVRSMLCLGALSNLLLFEGSEIFYLQ